MKYTTCRRFLTGCPNLLHLLVLALIARVVREEDLLPLRNVTPGGESVPVPVDAVRVHAQERAALVVVQVAHGHHDIVVSELEYKVGGVEAQGI